MSPVAATAAAAVAVVVVAAPTSSLHSASDSVVSILAADVNDGISSSSSFAPALLGHISYFKPPNKRVSK